MPDDPVKVEWTFSKTLEPVGWHFPEATLGKRRRSSSRRNRRGPGQLSRDETVPSLFSIPMGFLPRVSSPTLHQDYCVYSTAGQKRWCEISKLGYEGNHGFYIVFSLWWLLFGSRWLPDLWWGAELSGDCTAECEGLEQGPLAQVSCQVPCCPWWQLN